MGTGLGVQNQRKNIFIAQGEQTFLTVREEKQRERETLQMQKVEAKPRLCEIKPNYIITFSGITYLTFFEYFYIEILTAIRRHCLNNLNVMDKQLIFFH